MAHPNRLCICLAREDKRAIQLAFEQELLSVLDKVSGQQAGRQQTSARMRERVVMRGNAKPRQQASDMM
jgi:hypothetical protein